MTASKSSAHRSGAAEGGAGTGTAGGKVRTVGGCAWSGGPCMYRIMSGGGSVGMRRSAETGMRPRMKRGLRNTMLHVSHGSITPWPGACSARPSCSPAGLLRDRVPAFSLTHDLLAERSKCLAGGRQLGYGVRCEPERSRVWTGASKNNLAGAYVIVANIFRRFSCLSDRIDYSLSLSGG